MNNISPYANPKERSEIRSKIINDIISAHGENIYNNLPLFSNLVYNEFMAIKDIQFASVIRKAILNGMSSDIVILKKSNKIDHAKILKLYQLKTSLSFVPLKHAFNLLLACYGLPVDNTKQPLDQLNPPVAPWKIKKAQVPKAQAPQDDFIIEGNTLIKYKGVATKVIIPDFITEIANSAFLDCGDILELTIPNSITHLPNGMCYNCLKLIKINMPDSIKTIGVSTFYGCSDLKELTLPNSVVSIGWNAFKYCTQLKKITLQNKLIDIGETAFFGCISLTWISLPDSLKIVGPKIFQRCDKLSNINQFSFKLNNCITMSPLKDFQIEKTKLIKYTGNKETIIIPNFIDSISDSAFADCNNITKIMLPNTIKSIGEDAFKNCSNLSTIKLPKSLKDIPHSAFTNCPFSP